MTRRKGLTAALLVAAIGLAGCGSDADQLVGVQMVRGVTAGLIKGRAAEVSSQPDAGLTRAALANVKTPLMLLTLERNGASAAAGRLAINGGVETWTSVDDRTVAYRQGTLVATRGFGSDLMSAQGPSAGQIASGSGGHDRVYYYLDGLDQSVRLDFRCTLAVSGAETIIVVQREYNTRHVIERCSGDSGNFVNEYWFDNALNLRQSRQWIGQQLGHLMTRRIID